VEPMDASQLSVRLLRLSTRSIVCEHSDLLECGSLRSLVTTVYLDLGSFSAELNYHEQEHDCFSVAGE